MKNNGIQNELYELYRLGLIDDLLAGKTSGEHIIWATDPYKNCRKDEQITATALTMSSLLTYELNKQGGGIEEQSRWTKPTSILSSTSKKAY